jgi:acylphosphatase
MWFISAPLGDGNGLEAGRLFMEEKAVQVRHVFVEGYVQGVGYRAFVCRWATRLEVSGWVRNRTDGEVEARVQGAAGDLDALLAEMRRGPRGSEVARLRIVEGDGSDAEQTGAFVVRPTI